MQAIQKNGFTDLTLSKNGHHSAIFARSAKDIEEGIPFYGRVFRFKDQHNRRFLEHIPETKAITIDQFLKKNPIPAKYQVDCEELSHEIMEFFVDPEDISERIQQEYSKQQPQFNQPTIPHQQPTYLDAQIRENIRLQAKAEIRDEYESRIRIKNDEIEAYMRKNLELTASISQMNSTKYAELDALRKEYESQITQSKQELAELKQEIAILKIKQEVNQPESPWKYILEKLGEMAPAAIQYLQAQQQPQPQQQSLQPHHEPQEQQDMTAQQFVQEFAHNLIELAKAKLNETNPELDQVIGFVHNNLEFMKANGVQVEAADWLNIAAEIANHALENKIAAEKLADVLFPVINHLVTNNTAKTMLKMVPATNVVDALCASYNVNPSPAVRKLLVKVIEQFKAKS
jgi:hypothetical protein